MFNRTFNNILVAGLLTTTLWACAAQQVLPSPEPLGDQPQIPTAKKSPTAFEDKGVLEERSLNKKVNEKKVLSKERIKDQPRTDKKVEEEHPNFNVSGLKHRVLGMDGTEIIKTLGFPIFRRLEPPARIWQYRTTVCVVNIFLYETDREVTAEYVEFLGQKNNNTDENGCFRSILKMRPAEQRRK